MAEGILYNLAANILTKLGSLPVEEIKLLQGVSTEISKLEDTVSTIRAVLLDAQERQFKSREVKDWLMKLEEVMYELDDLLDSVSTEKLWRAAKTNGKKAKAARIFFSSSNQLVFRHKIGKIILSIREKLDGIAKDRLHFHFNEQLVEDSVVRKERPLTDSYVREEDVIGRDRDKKVILDFLFNPQAEKSVSVLSIWGLGGLGKTTLAQSLYNHFDETGMCKKYFELKKWVCVSNHFDLPSIVKALLDPEDFNQSEMKQKLVEKLDGKRFLIVLDDVWNHERAKWLDLMTLLYGGARGSKVLVTTREERVAKVCGDTVEPYRLEGLNPDQSWATFCKVAFVGGKEPVEKDLITIGKEVVRKCRGVPLAIRVLGSMLYSIDIAQWSSFMDLNFSSIDQLRDNIMPILQVSYDHLPSHLKHCFAYCAFFPQDYEYNVEMLVNLWIAQGFIQSSNTSLEDMGYQYCKDLIERSLFQNVKTDIYGTLKQFKLHDLMNNLACSVSRMYRCGNHHGNVHHVRGSSWPVPVGATKLRSFVIFNVLRPVDISFPSVCQATPLRVLDLKNANLKKVPDCIGKLKHLRYLNLSKNEIRKLPNSICRLQNLHTLILDGCRDLISLPVGMSKLVNLTHLSMINCINAYDMPSGLGKLTSLKTLTHVYTSRIHGKLSLSDLNSLNQLKWSLDINFQILAVQAPMEAKNANLKGKNNLRNLRLLYAKNDEMVEAFQPHENLKKLKMIGFHGVVKIPKWLSTLTNLVSIMLQSSSTCQCLPPMHYLPALKSLKLRDLSSLEYIADGEELLTSPSSSVAASLFPSLEHLELRNLPELKSWWKIKAINGKFYQFPSLSRLEISSCPVLSFI